MSDPNRTDSESLKDTRWAGVIEESRQWESDASEWESGQVEGFIEQIRLLAEHKCNERKKAGRDNLQKALDQLREDNVSEIAFFGFDKLGIASWHAANCPADHVSERAKTVGSLLEQLNMLRTLNQQSPQNYEETRKHRTDLNDTEDRITSLAKQLDKEFAVAEPEPQQTLHEDTVDDDEPDTEPPKPGNGPSGDRPDSDEEQQAKKEAHPLEDDSKKETSSAEQETKAEQPEESQPKPTQPTTSAPQPQEKKPPTLRSVQDVAALLQKNDSDENWESLGWSLLAEGDWTGAYWLARSLEAKGHDVPLSPELLAVLQGSRWLEDDADSLVRDILEIASDWAPQTTTEKLLGLAAALRPSLIAPHAGLVVWLPQRDEVNPALGMIADAVRTFAVPGFPLRLEDLQGVENEANLTETIAITVENARRILETNQDRRLKIRRATNVLRRMLDREGDLSIMLTPIKENEVDQVDQVRERVSNFQRRDQILDRIHQIDRELTSARPSRPMTGVPREQLIRSIEEAVSLGDRWCALIKHQEQINSNGDWWTNHVKELRSQIQRTQPHVTAELDRMQRVDQSQDKVACGRILQAAMCQVYGMLGLAEETDREDSYVWMRMGSSSLRQALIRRLLWIPELDFHDNAYPSQEYIPKIAAVLQQSLAKERTLSEAWAKLIEGMDFRFAEVLRNALADQENRQQIEDRYDEALKGSQAALSDEISSVRGAIEQGMVDGLLSEEERAGLTDRLETVANDDALNFAPLFQRLNEIKSQLDQKRTDRLQDLDVQWREIRQRLSQKIQSDQLDAEDAFVQKAFNQSDIRVINERLVQLGDVVNGTSEWESERVDTLDGRDVLEEFRDACQEIESALSNLENLNKLPSLIEQGQTWGGVPFGTLPKVRRDEAAKAIKSWHQLKRQRGQFEAARRHIPVLLGYLGFRLSETETAVKRKKSEDPDWLHCQVDASASDLARPIPQLGSQANGCYDVVCMWERPGAASIGAFLRDRGLDAKTVIVFYLGRLSERRRRDIAALAGARELALVVLDEVLLLFLAKCDDTRLPDFLRCSLPYAALNPYMPFQAGNVPPEMYYGRDAMVRQLQGEGSCIVFGGRQLGKSALLRQVERAFHQPRRDQFAWVEDIKLVGDTLAGEQPHQLWIKLRDGFKKHSLIGERVTATQPDNIINHIENAMDVSLQRRVLVLFDEADSFLGEDAQNSFKVVEKLRSLMQDTQFRFKVVFAGLHNVQRFNDIPNQPLAHFGENLQVGPLEAPSARQLVREPLETLGYRFVDETTVLKVLSYTNYHPGLIQYFCHELVRRLQAKRSTTGPPYSVLSEDVEAVYRSSQARQVIRERLDWTLALDSRYQCIAWAMIYVQKETRDSYVRSFSVNELLQLAREWWPQGFDNVDTEALRGLLGEMVGLGILVHNVDENQYLLRSPNLVRLMGTEEDIEDRLLELSIRPHLTRFQPDSHHVLLDGRGRRYSPLTLVEEGRLQQAGRSGVSLVFGSQALGLDVLDQALIRIGGIEIPAQELVQANRICAWLNSHARKQRGVEQSLTYGRLRGTSGEMAKCVWKVSEMCRDFNQRRRRPLQVVFLLKPEAAWTWLKVPPDQRTGLEDKVDPIYLRRWDEVGIRQRLSQAGKLDSPEVYQIVMKATGGWSFLLDDLLRRCQDHDDPRSLANALVEDLDRPSSTLGEELLQQTGLVSQGESLRVLRTLVEIGRFSYEDLETLGDLVEGTPELSREDCMSVVEFLTRLGCLNIRNGECRVEPVLGRIVGHL